MLTNIGGHDPIIWFNVDPTEIAKVLQRALTDAGFSPEYKGPLGKIVLFPVENDMYEANPNVLL